jgi:hypothetical protein
MMTKPIALALMLALSSPLASCNTPSVADAAPVTVANAEKGLTIAHLAYNGLSATILTATQTGLLKGQNAATVKVYYDKARDALLAADAADKALNTQGIIAAVQAAQDAIALASSIVSPKP